MENIRRYALPMKSLTEAMTLRNQLLLNFEKALTVSRDEKRQRLLNIVVVGGGATGVEISGALSEMKRYVLKKDYPELTKNELNIYLIEGSPRLLGSMSEASSAKALKFLQNMGVEVMTNTKVVDYVDNQIILDQGEPIRTDTIIWVSGVKANFLEGIPSEAIGRGGRIYVDEYNRLKGEEHIFAIGDICLQTETDYPNGHPQVAQVALQQAKHLVKNLKRHRKGDSLHPFHYHNKGTLATVGRNRAVAELPHIKTQGFFAWFLWDGCTPALYFRSEKPAGNFIELDLELPDLRSGNPSYL